MNERPRPSRVGAKLHTFGPCSLSRALERVGFEMLWAGCTWKMMDLRDLNHRFAQYTHPLLRFAPFLLNRLSPRALCHQMFSNSAGKPPNRVTVQPTNFSTNGI
jgi:hypothetical protein